MPGRLIKVAMVGGVAAVAAAIVLGLPDIKRYLEIRQM